MVNILATEEAAQLIKTPPIPIQIYDRETLIEAILESIGDDNITIAIYNGAWKDYMRVRELLVRKGLNPYLYYIIDTLEFKLSPLDPSQILLSKYSMAMASQSNKALFKIEPSKTVDRRTLLRGGIQGLMSYKPAPIMYNEAVCGSWKYCTNCVESCPQKALVGKPPRVNLDACTGCGICVSSCPFGLLFMPQLNVEAFDYFIDKIREKYREPAFLVISCYSALDSLANYLGNSQASNLFVLEVDCPGWISQYHLIQAVARGFKPVLFCDDDQLSLCGGAETVNKWLKELEPLGVYPSITRTVEELAEALASPVNVRDLGLEESIIKNKTLIYKVLYEYGVEELTVSSPLVGNIMVDDDKCLLCDTCMNMCPFKAIYLDKSGDKVRLLFRQDRCVACGICEKTCPYNALKLEYKYKKENTGKWVPVAEDEVARCRRCGRPIGSKKHLMFLEKKLRESGVDEWVLEQLWLCERCKVQALIERQLKKNAS